MRTAAIIERSLSPMLQSIHATRLKAVFWAVRSLLAGGRLTLTGVGRSGCERGTSKHSIKRADRLLGNKHLHAQLPEFYRAVAHMLLQPGSRPVILLDWTRVEPMHIALVATLPMDGRSIPIYLEVHHQNLDSNPDVMKRFLQMLKTVLPQDCRPILVTDAGFRNPWFRAVQSMGWDFVGRLRNNPDVQEAGHSEWVKLKTLYAYAKSTALDLGDWLLTRSSPLKVRIVAFRKKRFTRKAEPAIGSAKLKRRRKMKEPWLLATTLSMTSAARIVRIYSKRMQIEETFRDVKNHRFGWSFRHARSTNEWRFAVLMLIATIAMLAATLTGTAAEQAHFHRGFQANTIRSRRVLSLFYLGALIMHGKEQHQFNDSMLEIALRHLRSFAKEFND